MSKLEQILESNTEEMFVVIDGFNDATIIGVDSSTMRLIYSVESCIDILCKEMNYEDAIEYFDFNIRYAYVGEKSPILCD